MKKSNFYSINICLLFISLHVNAETLSQYVSACESQLGFQASNIPSTLDCYDGDLFAPGPSPISDYIGYRRITDQVDLTFACRWLGGDKTDRKTAVSIELMLHNHQNDKTCFFAAKNQGPGFAIPSLITSPVNCAQPNTSNCAADAYWLQPPDVDTTLRCIGCHVSGPYIATPRIAPYLAKYGLLNNGHDTLSNVSINDLFTPNKNVKYHVVIPTANGVVGAFSQWDSLKQSYINPVDSSCSLGCHMIGTSSTQGAVSINPAGTVLLDPQEVLDSIFQAGAMPPYDESSDYRWINLDTPGDGVESENYAAAMSATNTLIPHLFDRSNYNCTPNGITNLLPGTSNNVASVPNDVPTDLEAHAVGIDAANSFVYSQVSWITEKLKYFDLKDGLLCQDADQDPGVTCRDFDVSYLCSNGTWTPFYNHTVNSGGGDDHEERTYVNAQVVAACGNTQPVGIRARVFLAARGGPVPQVIIGPNDRLARFSQYGLTCNNSDQPDGKCSNYVVRYHYCGNPPASSYAAHLTSSYTGKQLTATSNSNGALVKGQPSTSGWNTQQWSIEPVANTEYVRLRDMGTNTYLNVTGQSTVVTSSFSTATSEMWILEPVTYGNDYRLKNLSSGKYLTIADASNYSPIYSQSKNPGSTSQRWLIQ